MSARPPERGPLPADLELSQHETPTLHWFEANRRDFLRVVGGGLLVCLTAPDAVLPQESGRFRGGRELPKDLAAWIHVDKDGAVTVFTGKVEVGQNIRTSLAQQAAEELRVPVASIRMVMGDTDRTPWDAGTFGSRTTPTMGPPIRAAAATAREALIDLAASRWNAARETLSAEDGKIRDAGGRAVSYGELTQGQDLVKTVPADAALTPPGSWKVAGAASPKAGGRDFVTGKHRYSSDVARPGMMHGKVLRPASFGATLASLATDKAAAIPGVQIVRDGDFVGVVAPDPGSAARAVAALDAKWNETPGQPSNANLFDYLKKNEDASERSQPKTTGSVEAALASADVRLSQTYTVQYIAHAPLEPRAAVAELANGKLTVWTGTQRPFAVKDELAAALRMPPEKIRVLVPDTGSAYGGKHTGDAAVEAARLAKAAGKPVKVAWTREDEFTWAYLRPAGVIEVKAGARRDGTLVAWEFHNWNSGPAGIETAYDVAAQTIQFHPVKSPLRQGSYRALASTANHFARESAMDELAHAVAMDPLAFRLKNLTNPRVRAVFEAAAEKFGWGKARAEAGRGFGIAGGTEKAGYVATCAEVEIEKPSRRVRIRRVTAAFECGAVVNPDGLRNQVEGALLQGIGGALFEAIRFENGRIMNPHFAEYRVPRFSDLPQVDVVILDRKDLPSSGAGECPIVGVAPALAGAIFAATGVRLRAMPLAPEGVPESSPSA
ncbi:MAG TPA: molybdopterin cofactor-binding domain-containing protein [Thermoanaerobaculia bacterium]